jgi:hypothetical protein
LFSSSAPTRTVNRTDRRTSPNPHKALGVKRKNFPRPRGAAFFWTPFLQGQGKRGEVVPRRPGFLSGADATPDRAGPGRAAPNTPADSGGPVPQSRAAVPGNKPRPVPIRSRSRLRGQSKFDGLTSSRGGSSSAGPGSRTGRVVRRSLLLRGAVAGGRVDLGWCSGTKPVFLGQPRADPVGPPTHRRGAARCLLTANGEKRARPASHPTVRLPGLRPRTYRSGPVVQ